MAEPLCEHKEFESYRLSCDCHDQRHLLDIGVEIEPTGGRIVSLEWSNYPVTWRERVRDAVKLLMGQKSLTCDLILRNKDVDILIKLLDKARNYYTKMDASGTTEVSYDLS